MQERARTKAPLLGQQGIPGLIAPLKPPCRRMHPIGVYFDRDGTQPGANTVLEAHTGLLSLVCLVFFPARQPLIIGCRFAF